MELVLASTSRYRRELLGRLGVPFTTDAPRCDEESVMSSGRPPEEVARELARRKARSLSETHPRAFILGSDQVVDLDGAILGKPGGEDGCLAQLERMVGRTHRLVTAAALRHPDGTVDEALVVFEMRMRPLDRDALRRYVQAERPFDCAGSYKIEGRGIALMEEMRGPDFTAVVGLPLVEVTSMLLRAGFQVP